MANFYWANDGFIRQTGIFWLASHSVEKNWKPKLWQFTEHGLKIFLPSLRFLFFPAKILSFVNLKSNSESLFLSILSVTSHLCYMYICIKWSHFKRLQIEPKSKSKYNNKHSRNSSLPVNQNARYKSYKFVSVCMY